MNAGVRVDSCGDGLQRISIDRPHAANALDLDTAQAFASALRGAQDDDAIGAVIVTGGGEKVFCAGVDLKNPDNAPEQVLVRRRSDSLMVVLRSMLDFDKPLIVAVNGAAVGVGCMVAMLGDQVIAAESAYFSLPEIDIGMPTFIGLELLAVIVGGGFAADLVLTGRRMPASEAARRGIADAVPPGALQGAAEDAARALSRKPRAAYALIKSAVQRTRRDAIDRGLQASEAARRILRSAR